MSIQRPHILTPSFFRRTDVTRIARELLGKYLCTEINGVLTSGMIVETEAYAAQGDKACHASGYNKTERNEAMFRAGGIAYVYLCYGIHHLFNVVTNSSGEPEAVLVRAIQPEDGCKTMLKRREHEKATPKLTGGPGRLSQALGIDLSHYGHPLDTKPLWLENRGMQLNQHEIEASPRIGVGYAGEDAEKPWRFTIAGNKWTSR